MTTPTDRHGPQHHPTGRASGNGSRSRRVITLAFAIVAVVAGAAVGGFASRIVIGLAGVRDWTTDLYVTIATTSLATTTTTYVLCERIVPRLGRTSRSAARRTVGHACLAGGLLVAALLVPVAPQTWLQALPPSAFVTLAGGLGVALAAGRERMRAARW